MGSAVSLRADFDGQRLRLLARQTRMPAKLVGSLRLPRSMRRFTLRCRPIGQCDPADRARLGGVFNARGLERLTRKGRHLANSLYRLLES
jgi:hypothetical protein